MFDFFKRPMRGDKILEIEKSQSDLDICYVLKEVRDQGATDADIREWWNMPDEQHKELVEEDDLNKITTLKYWIDSGMSEDEAVVKIKKGYPIYGIYAPGIMHHDKDDILPYELKNRINNFFSSSKKDLKYKDELEKHSSINAFIRSLIKKGVI